MAVDQLRIEKTTVLPAPRPRVWEAIADAQKFGAWFGVRFDQPFAEGQAMTGQIVPTAVDPEIAKLQAPHTGTPFHCTVDAIAPRHRFAFRWHPFAIDPAVDYTQEPTTLVEFLLSEVPGGTQLTITESGFEGLPVERRVKAFEANAGGWAAQLGLIEKYLAQ